MPKLTEAHFAARKEQILKAAFQCLARKGYSRLTVRDIAAEAGISVGTLYLHFENKQEIVKALTEQERELDEAGLEGIPVEGGPLEALGAVFEFLIERLDDPDSARGLAGRRRAMGRGDSPSRSEGDVPGQSAPLARPVVRARRGGPEGRRAP